jgi:hypothetical protein
MNSYLTLQGSLPFDYCTDRKSWSVLKWQYADGSSGHYDIIYKFEQQDFSVLTVRQPNASQFCDLIDPSSMFANVFPDSWHNHASSGLDYGPEPNDYAYSQLQSQFPTHSVFEPANLYGTPLHTLPLRHPPLTFNQFEYPASTHAVDKSFYGQPELYQPSPPPPPSRMPSASCPISPPTPLASPSPGLDTSGLQIRHHESSSANRQHSNLPLDPRTFGT